MGGDKGTHIGKELVDAIDVREHLELTNEMREDILDALAGYLKERTR